eukprot:3078299-Rhodomonas_salina.1
MGGVGERRVRSAAGVGYSGEGVADSGGTVPVSGGPLEEVRIGDRDHGTNAHSREESALSRGGSVGLRALQLGESQEREVGMLLWRERGRG